MTDMQIEPFINSDNIKCEMLDCLGIGSFGW